MNNFTKDDIQELSDRLNEIFTPFREAAVNLTTGILPLVDYEPVDWQARALDAEKRGNELKLENNKLRLQLMRRNRR